MEKKSEAKKQLKAQRGKHWRLTQEMQRTGAQETRHTNDTGDQDNHDRT